MSVALATCRALPQLDGDDQPLHRALRQRNVPVDVVVWDDPTVDWSRYKLCVIRSTWDYVPKRDAYLRWAEQVASQTTLWNPAPLIRWNTEKSYLNALQGQGIPVVETHWLDAGATVSLSALLQKRDWDEVVIKPVISASGKDTIRASLKNREKIIEAEAQLTRLLSTQAMMIQPFMPSVLNTGELSFIFIDGQFSHAVSKTPAPNEFRIQEHFGGRNQRFEATPEQLRFAEAVLEATPWPPLYARVDAMLDERAQLRLSELEVTEPSLYLAHASEAAQHFANAIIRRL